MMRFELRRNSPRRRSGMPARALLPLALLAAIAAGTPLPAMAASAAPIPPAAPQPLAVPAPPPVPDPAPGPAKRVVATIPDLADMARNIGGGLLDVKSVTKGTEDMHSVPVKPSLLLVLNRADALLIMGLDMEHAWLPDLLYNCRNDRIQPGAPGFVNCSARIDPIEVPDTPSRSQGEMHPEGNPHFNTDPHQGRLTAITVCDGLCRAFPEDAPAFRANLKAYLARFDRKLREWDILARPLRGTKVITYHTSWGYFAKSFGLEVAAEIEPAPGIAPTPAHIAKLVRLIKQRGVELIVKEHYYSDRYPKFLAEKTGVKWISLPSMCGGAPGTEHYFDFVEYNIKSLLKVLGKPVATPEEIRRELESQESRESRGRDGTGPESGAAGGGSLRLPGGSPRS